MPSLTIFWASMAGRPCVVVERHTWRSSGNGLRALGRLCLEIINADWPLRVVDPAWTPKRPPVTIDELRANGLSPVFAEYMRRFQNFVV